MHGYNVDLIVDPPSRLSPTFLCVPHELYAVGLPLLLYLPLENGVLV